MHRKWDLAALWFLLVFALPICSFAQSDFIFPVVANTPLPTDCRADCRYWTSFFTLFNPNSTATSLKFTAYDSNGNITASSETILVPPFQNYTPPGIFRTGWVKISASQPVMPREKIQFVSATPGTRTDVRSQISLGAAGLSRQHFVNTESFAQIGLSIVFPGVAGNLAATGKVIQRNWDGKLIREKAIVVPPNGQMTAYLRELFPTPPNTPDFDLFVGSYEIVFDQDVAVTALEFGASETIEEEIIEAFSGAGTAR